MTGQSDMDRILSPWLYENGAQPPPVTRLLSASGPGSADVRVTPDQLDEAARAAGEIADDLKLTTQASNDFAVQAAGGLKDWETAAALKYMGETWDHQTKNLETELRSIQQQVAKSASWYRTDDKKIKDDLTAKGN